MAHGWLSEECATLYLRVMGPSSTLGVEITRIYPGMDKNDTKSRSGPEGVSKYFIDTLKGVKQGSDIECIVERNYYS